jgi:hypothetical protein
MRLIRGVDPLCLTAVSSASRPRPARVARRRSADKRGACPCATRHSLPAASDHNPTPRQPTGPETPNKPPIVAGDRCGRVAGRGLGGGHVPRAPSLSEPMTRFAERWPGRPPAAGAPAVRSVAAGGLSPHAKLDGMAIAKRLVHIFYSSRKRCLPFAYKQ